MPNTSFYTPLKYHSSALETFALVTGSSSSVYGNKLLAFNCGNADGYTNYVQIFDGYAQPQAGAVPIASFIVGSASDRSFGVTVEVGIPVSNGIVIALSSTQATYTAVTNKMFLTALFI